MRPNSLPNELEMENLGGFVDTKGLETNLKLTFGHFNIYGGYVYNDPITHTDNKNTPFRLTSKHVIKGDFVWEVHGKYMFGIDLDYRSEQTLSTGRIVPSLLTGGFLLRYTYNGIDFYFNTENITNQRQSQIDKSVLSPPYNTPQYTEVWAPQEGFVYNFGIRANITKAAASMKKK
jgi:iron complex outermembrane receptor protein